MAGKTIGVCSLARSDTEYTQFISVLKEEFGVCVKYVHISSRILENGHDFSQYDGVILIHSVFTSRMSLTNVRDARYDKLLLHWKQLLGRDRVAVIVTGVERTDGLEERFKEKQRTVSECSAHVLFCEAKDPMNDERVANQVKFFVRLLPHRPKVGTGQARPSMATPQLSADNSNKETMTIVARKAKCAGIDVKYSGGNIHVELIICAERSTRKTLLKTLSEDDLTDEADFLVFQEKAPNDWELLKARSITGFDPSSEMLNCAVFIFRNGVPPDFTDWDFKSFEKIINERKSSTDIEVSGEADKSCMQQLLQVFLECAYNDHIVTVSSGDVQMASSLSGKQTQREREHQCETTLKKEARGRIQILNRTIGTLRQELSCKEDELATCEENISAKYCEKKYIERDIDANQKKLGREYEKLQSVKEQIEEAQQKLNESRRELENEETATRKAKKEVNKTERKKAQELKDRESGLCKKERELKDWESGLCQKEKELEDWEIAVNKLKYQIQNENEEGEQELSGWEAAVKEEINTLNRLQKDKQQLSNELHDLQKAIREANEKQKQEKQKQVAEDLHDRGNVTRSAEQNEDEECFQGSRV